MREPEPEVVARARRGDASALEELIRECQPHVYRFALRILRDPHIAADVTQETFIKVYRSLRTFRGGSKFTTWVYRIARNSAVDAMRRSGHQRRLAEQLRPAEEAPDPAQRADLSRAVDALPEHLREAFLLIEVFGLTYREAAKVLGVVSGTLKSRMHSARKELMRTLGEEESADEV